jgi:hypothetical protein
MYTFQNQSCWHGGQLNCKSAPEIELAISLIVDILSSHEPMMNDYLLRFRQLSTPDLQALQTALQAQESNFPQQSKGTTSFTRDLKRLDDKLNAIAYVLRERGPVTINPPCQSNPSIGTTDFQNIQ